MSREAAWMMLLARFYGLAVNVAVLIFGVSVKNPGDSN